MSSSTCEPRADSGLGKPADAPPESLVWGLLTTARWNTLTVIFIVTQATDLPGSDSVKRLAAASGLYADAGNAPFPRPEVHSCASALCCCRADRRAFES